MSTSFEDKLAAVPAHLSELIRRQLAGESAAPAEDRPIRPVPRTAGLPMSSAQQRLWFMAELEPDSAEYNALRALRLRGDLDVEALTVAVNRVVERHESLRTTFDAVDGRGVQIVHEHVDRALPVVDVSGRGSAARVEEFLLREMGSPYDLRGGPLLRVTLLRLGERDHVLVLGAHHIVVDGWSTGNLLAELAAVYTAELCGTPAQLPPLPVQYADYAAWQREREADGTLDGPLAYWRGRLDRMPVLELPADRPRPPVRTPAGAVHEFEVPAELVARLRELGRSNGATLFMVLVAAAKLLLGRYSGERDIAVGTVTSGRGHPDLDHLIGSFINTLVLRSQVDESLSFTAFVRQVRATLLEAYANEEVPFQRLVEALRPERDPSRPPLVQVMVNLQNLADGAPRLPGLEVSEIQPPMNVAKLDLTFDFYEDARSLTCYLEYSTDLYDRATVERLAGHLVTLLGAVAAAPDAPLWTRDILPEAELRDLTAAALGPSSGPVPARRVHELFDEQAARRPDDYAVSCGDERLTFAELAAGGNRLARHLTGLGVGPGALVGICLERGVDAVVAMLGVLKAGAAFLPLDPEHPAQRLATMLDDADASVVITEHRLRDRLAGHDATLVDLDRDRQVLDGLPALSPDVAGTPDDLAYVVYTSGSTGKPKGVMVSHRNVHHIMRAWDARYGLKRLRGSCLSVSSVAVDVFFGDFLLSAMFGGELLICPPEVMSDPPALVAMLRERAPEIMVTTPSLAKAISQELAAAGGALDSLRVLAVGSEPWPADDCRALLDHVAAHTIVANAYGATETTVDSTIFDVRAEPIGSAATVPVGRPMLDTPGARARRAHAPGARGGVRRGLHRRRRRGAGVLEPAGPDRAAFRPRPLLRRARGQAVPDGRRRPPARRRQPGARRTGGRPGEGARLPGRAGRGGGRDDAPPRHRRRGRRRPQGRVGPRAAGRLPRPRRGPGARPGRAAGLPRRHRAGPGGAVRPGDAGGAADDAQRHAGPPRPARSREGGAGGRPSGGAPYAGRDRAGGDLGGGPGPRRRRGRRRGQLLRPRRRLYPRPAGGLPRAAGRPAADRQADLPAPDRRRARRGRRHRGHAPPGGAPCRRRRPGDADPALVLRGVPRRARPLQPVDVPGTGRRRRRGRPAYGVLGGARPPRRAPAAGRAYGRRLAAAPRGGRKRRGVPDGGSVGTRRPRPGPRHA